MAGEGPAVNTSPISEAGKDNPSALIELFELHLTDLERSILRFTNTDSYGESIVFGGHQYRFWPCQSEGFEWAGKKNFPMPTLIISDIDGFLGRLIRKDDAVLGARFVRIKTFAAFLDGGTKARDPNADPLPPLAKYPDEVFVVDKRDLTRISITLELQTALDQEGAFLPKRVLNRDYCSKNYRYRVNNNTAWAHKGSDVRGRMPDDAGYDPLRPSNVDCEYVGEQEWDSNGNPLPADQAGLGRCGKSNADCIRRFGENGQALATWSFPGVGIDV